VLIQLDSVFAFPLGIVESAVSGGDYAIRRVDVFTERGDTNANSDSAARL
jgi:hypothetical protein